MVQELPAPGTPPVPLLLSLFAAVASTRAGLLTGRGCKLLRVGAGHVLTTGLHGSHLLQEC